jgi:hypothetical protein
LPSSADVLSFLADTIVDAKVGNESDILIDTSIGSMEASEIPVPTYERMPGCSKNSFYSLLFFMIRDISYLHVLDQN